ncbi:serine hydrolase [Emticicia sp. C21]|uniref:serine hydrolase domain-containing protein n=1 Tax=Emticicia sp. C21 TaxID=2302915 RepID=UPI000E343D9F|nr:serine hydrolase domain-containing protein [Emticicia sp. C21]RFS13378.1 class A beta-lactamase-related serine hydrolase [Emticicia sp. C21]
MKYLYSIVFIFLLHYTTFSQTLGVGTPESQGMSTQRLQRIDKAVNDYIDKSYLSGVVVLVARNGKIVYHKGLGYDDIETKKAMDKDAVFRIASQTKAITSVAVMMLYEEGKFLLDDPISKYIPSFRNPTVLDKFNPKDSSYTTVPAKREITIRDLLTHTSGISYAGIGTREAIAIYAKNNIPGGVDTPFYTLEDAINRLAKLPLIHNPGEKFTYGLNTDVLGYFVEVMSGMSFDAFLQERIFKPIGMKDTYFYLPESKFSRLAGLYTEDKNKKVMKVTGDYGNYSKKKGTYFSGGGGLVSTVTDYAMFLQMLLNGGKYNGQQLLSPVIINMMIHNQIGDIKLGNKKFGLGFALTTEAEAARLTPSEGTFDWGGAYSTAYWADPKEGIIGMIMTQKIPNSYADIGEKFKVMVYQAITKLN